jgi:hypothetical protein
MLLRQFDISAFGNFQFEKLKLDIATLKLFFVGPLASIRVKSDPSKPLEPLKNDWSLILIGNVRGKKVTEN